MLDLDHSWRKQQNTYEASEISGLFLLTILNKTGTSTFLINFIIIFMKWVWLCLSGTWYIPSELPARPVSNLEFLDTFKSHTSIWQQPDPVCSLPCFFLLWHGSLTWWGHLGTPTAALHFPMEGKTEERAHTGFHWGFWAIFARGVRGPGNPKQQLENVSSSKSSSHWGLSPMDRRVGEDQSSSEAPGSYPGPLLLRSQWFWCWALCWKRKCRVKIRISRCQRS